MLITVWDICITPLHMQQTDKLGLVETNYDVLEIKDSIEVFGQTLVETIDTDKWYDISLAMNLTTQKADVYLDDQKKLEGIGLPVVL